MGVRMCICAVVADPLMNSSQPSAKRLLATWHRSVLYSVGLLIGGPARTVALGSALSNML